MAINPAIYSSSRDDWETPENVFDELNKEFNFQLDAAADKKNRLCEVYFDKRLEGALSDKSDWSNKGKISSVFVNPPYSMMREFVKKGYEESLSKKITVVMLIASRTDTKVFHDYVMKAKEIRFIKGRLKFCLNSIPSKNAASFPSAVVIFDGKKHRVPKIRTWIIKK